MTEADRKRLEDVKQKTRLKNPPQDECCLCWDDVDWLVTQLEQAWGEVEQLRNGRVPCACGKDDAAAKNAKCYQCRNKPYWEIEALEADNAALRRQVESLSNVFQHYHVAHYIDGQLTEECDKCGRDLRDSIHRRMN